jgi:hypothetical protein
MGSRCEFPARSCGCRSLAHTCILLLLGEIAGRWPVSLADASMTRAHERASACDRACAHVRACNVLFLGRSCALDILSDIARLRSLTHVSTCTLQVARQRERLGMLVLVEYFCRYPGIDTPRYISNILVLSIVFCYLVSIFDKCDRRI